MCVAFYRPVKSVCLLLALMGGNSALAAEIGLRGTLDSGVVQSREMPQQYVNFTSEVQDQEELRLWPILEDSDPVLAKPIGLPEPQTSFWGFSYSPDLGFGYQYSERTKLSVGLGLWSVRMGVTRSLPVPAPGATAQSFW